MEGAREREREWERERGERHLFPYLHAFNFYGFVFFSFIFVGFFLITGATVVFIVACKRPFCLFFLFFFFFFFFFFFCLCLWFYFLNWTVLLSLLDKSTSNHFFSICFNNRKLTFVAYDISFYFFDFKMHLVTYSSFRLTVPFLARIMVNIILIYLLLTTY